MEVVDESDTEELLNVQKQFTSQENISSRPKDLPKCYPTTSRASFSSDVGFQCKVSTAEESTNYNIYNLYPSRAMEVMETTTSDNSLLSNLHQSENLSVNDLQERQFVLELIYKNPKRILGIPKKFLWSLKYITEQYGNGISELALITTLYRIKQNEPMGQISDQFQIPKSDLKGMFISGVECLANFYQNLIYLPSPNCIKINLPTVFKNRFPKVQCILHCFEIEIETPSDPMLQARTWSKYKSGSTLKYLIGCTPNGFVAFISKGYGGRISNRDILERSKFIDILPVNAMIMADWGFEDAESHLTTKGVKLLCPHRHLSVNSGTTSPQEHEITKIIPALRAHVNKVNKRLIQFQMLYPLSEVRHKHVGYMDEIVIIACGLINLQVMLVKKK